MAADERLRQLAAVADAIGRRFPGVRIAGYRHDVDQNAQGRGQIDAAAEQNAEIAAEQAGAIEPEDGADAGQLRDRTDHRGASAGRRSSHHTPAMAAAANRIAAVALARRKSDRLMKKPSAVSVRAEILQHGRELRQHEQDEEQHHADRRDQHEGRILHRVRQLAAHRFRPRPLRAKHLEHLVERARNFADAHQRDIHRRKQRGMFGHRVGEALAAEQRRTQLRDHRAQPADIGVAGQEFERVVETRAGLQQQREIAGEGRHLGGARLAEQAKATEPDAARFSSTVSIGSSRRYSMRRATSVGVGAEIVPCTISPVCVRAR